MFQRTFFLIAIIVALSGCAILHVETGRPVTDILPESYSTDSKHYSTKNPWWISFHSEELDTLIRTGLAGNNSLRQTRARLAQAQATADAARAGLFPEVDGNTGAAHNRTGNEDGTETGKDDFSLGVSASYEVDLWGRVRSGINSAELERLADREDLYSAAMTLSAAITTSWLELISDRQREARLMEQLDLNRRLLELVELRFATSQASALDVYQQRQTINGIEGALINVRATQRTSLHQLGVLTGRPPAADLDADQQDFPEISEVPPGGLPADLLSHRPDILAAQHRLESASWSVTQAKADRLPRLRLNGSFTYNSSLLDTLLDEWLLRLAAEVTGPIIDGGRRKAEVERTRAVVEERLAGYRQTVLTAIQEVEDALVLEQRYRRSISNIDEQIRLVRMAYREAAWRYLNGLSDYLPVLREQINLITSQQDRISAERNLLANRVSLHRALGGTWPERLLAENSPGSPTTENTPEKTIQ